MKRRTISAEPPHPPAERRDRANALPRAVWSAMPDHTWMVLLLDIVVEADELARWHVAVDPANR